MHQESLSSPPPEFTLVGPLICSPVLEHTAFNSCSAACRLFAFGSRVAFMRSRSPEASMVLFVTKVSQDKNSRTKNKSAATEQGYFVTGMYRGQGSTLDRASGKRQRTLSPRGTLFQLPFRQTYCRCRHCLLQYAHQHYKAF